MPLKVGLPDEAGGACEPTAHSAACRAHLKAGREARTTATVAASIADRPWVSRGAAEQLGDQQQRPAKRNVHNGSALHYNNWVPSEMINEFARRRPGP